ncbi:serine/threonine protein kinase [Actinomadura nitritigenes]|uniref:non-specific serine/threonine protein kinase n=2 Tax=Actinomadura nitritigenes TaxID=134602 RepID=A0ABS3RA15_9ACTN|nr:serine/threonine protein kinase [Actinomadura nitritigenes]
MGTVWRAFDLALHREVALKEVRLAGADPSGDDPAVAEMLRERVMREARALARLHHPNVVTIHHIVDSPDMPHPWLVMELVPGRSLQDRLADGPLPPAEAAAIGRGILAALRAAHEAGICHRDVKPANVLLRTDGTAVLTDFGIAVLEEASRVTATGGLVGSPEYIAPERLHGREGDPASDLWSLGLLLYVAVEGGNPLRRPTAAATLAAVMAARIPPPRHAGPLARALQALLVADPAARPTASELDHLLAQAADALQSPPPSSPFPPPVQHAGPGTDPGAFPGTASSPPPGRRRRTGLIIGAIAVPLACVAAVLLVTAAVFVPELLDRTGDAATGEGLPSGPVDAGGDRSPATAAAGPRTLLTPAAVRDVIRKFEKASGSRQFAEMTVYAGRATADAPVRGRRGAFDGYTYEKGADAAVRTGPSVGVTDDAKVNLSGFNWNALPGLMSRAARTLKVPKPTNKYVIAKASWAFNGDRPTMMVYFTDDYGGGYLAANAQGKVIKIVPSGS